MALTTAFLASSLQSIGISQARGVDLPMLRDQNNATLPKSKGGVTASADNSGGESSGAGAATRFTASQELTAAQQRQVARLQQIERDVIAHEQAHIAAGHGLITSGPNYTYTYGPDGKRYAIGGEVGIDTAAERKAEANIDKGIRIQAAALAPKDPSAQDYQVAAVGEQLETQGRTDLIQEQRQQQAEAEATAQAHREAEQTPTTEAASPVEGQESSFLLQAAQGQAQPGVQDESSRQNLARAYTPSQGGGAEAAVNVFA